VWAKYRYLIVLEVAANWTSLRKKVMICYLWGIALYCAEYFVKWIINSLKVLKCGAGEGRGRSFALAMGKRKY
jgi:hypothetical protein